MDSSLYKSVATRRGLTYNYYFSAPIEGKPVLLFVHGFPNTSNDWRYQVSFFKDQGYGLIVPDMLGYGGTDKPTEVEKYTLSAMSQDVVDILDVEKADKVIAVGHDWGSILVSRLANYFPERFSAFAFLVVGYVSPTDVPFTDFLAFTKKMVGYELFGYWLFMGEEDAHKTIESHFDSFYNMLLAEDPKLWISQFAPIGALKAWIKGDNMAPAGQYLTEEEVKLQKEVLLQGGLQGPLNWYKVRVSGLDIEDTKNIAADRYAVQQPIFFGGAAQDYVCIPALGKAVLGQYAKGPVTVKEYESGHWVQWQAKDKVNQDLLEWVQAL